MLVLLDVGHSPHSPGACNKASQTHEFPFNDKLAEDIIASYKGPHTLKKFYRSGKSFNPDEVKEHNPDCVISLHCNSFNEKASYTTVLYAKGKEDCKALAKILQKNLVKALGLKDADIRPIVEGDRGGKQCHAISCPNVISEPFFIDNDKDFETAKEKRARLIQAYQDTINEFLPASA